MPKLILTGWWGEQPQGKVLILTQLLPCPKAVGWAPLSPVQIPTTLAASLFTSASPAPETQWPTCDAVVLPRCCRSLCPCQCFLTQHNQRFFFLLNFLVQSQGLLFWFVAVGYLLYNRQQEEGPVWVWHRGKELIVTARRCEHACSSPSNRFKWAMGCWKSSKAHCFSWSCKSGAPAVGPRSNLLLSREIHLHMWLPPFPGDPFWAPEGPYFCSQEISASSLHSHWQHGLTWAVKLQKKTGRSEERGQT